MLHSGFAEGGDVVREGGLTRAERILAAWTGFVVSFIAFVFIVSSVVAISYGAPVVLSLLLFALGAAVVPLGAGAIHGAIFGRRTKFYSWALNLSNEK